MKIRVPFQGFYESIHSDEVDEAYKQLITDDNGEPFESLEDELYQHMNTKPYEPYAKQYTVELSEYIEDETGVDLALTFHDLYSPQFYNYETDTITANITKESLIKLYEGTDKKLLAKYIERVLKPRSGFVPFYNNALDEWPDDVTDWDQVQAGVLMEAFMEENGLLDDVDTEIIMRDGMNEASMNAVDETMSKELLALCDKAYEMREVLR